MLAFLAPNKLACGVFLPKAISAYQRIKLSQSLLLLLEKGLCLIQRFNSFNLTEAQRSLFDLDIFKVGNSRSIVLALSVEELY